jgi:hypothetical protein
MPLRRLLVMSLSFICLAWTVQPGFTQSYNGSCTDPQGARMNCRVPSFSIWTNKGRGLPRLTNLQYLNINLTQQSGYIGVSFSTYLRPHTYAYPVQPERFVTLHVDFLDAAGRLLPNGRKDLDVPVYLCGNRSWTFGRAGSQRLRGIVLASVKSVRAVPHRLTNFRRTEWCR